MQSKRKTDGGRARIQDMQNLKFAMPVAPNGKINLNPDWLGQTTKDKTAMATFEYDLPYNMMVSGGFGHMKSRYSGAFGQINSIKQNGDFRVSGIRGMDFVSRTTSGNLKLQGKTETGPILHNWSLAFDSVERQRDHDQSSKTNGAISAGSIYSPKRQSLSAVR